MIKPELLASYSEPTPMPIFTIGRIPPPKAIEAADTTWREKIGKAWNMGQEDLVRMTQSASPEGEAIRKFFTRPLERVILTLPQVGRLVGEEDNDRLRKVRTALGIGRLVRRIDIGVCEFSQEELAQYAIGIMANKIYWAYERQERRFKAESAAIA